MRKFRAGDEVFHHPSKENWKLACDASDNGDVLPCGWPCTIAHANDCELIQAATDTERWNTLVSWSHPGDAEKSRDIRHLTARQQVATDALTCVSKLANDTATVEEARLRSLQQHKLDYERVHLFTVSPGMQIVTRRELRDYANATGRDMYGNYYVITEQQMAELKLWLRKVEDCYTDIDHTYDATEWGTAMSGVITDVIAIAESALGKVNECRNLAANSFNAYGFSMPPGIESNTAMKTAAETFWRADERMEVHLRMLKSIVRRLQTEYKS